MRKKERKIIYIAPLYSVQSQGAQNWITQFYLHITPCLPFLRQRSPDGASTKCGGEHLLAAHYSFIDPDIMKGWVGLVGWPIADGLPTEGDESVTEQALKWTPNTHRKIDKPRDSWKRSGEEKWKQQGSKTITRRWRQQPKTELDGEVVCGLWSGGSDKA